jgi:hypothetical protein
MRASEERAAELLGLWLREQASVRTAFSQRQRARAWAQGLEERGKSRERRRELWLGDPDHYALFESLMEITGHALDELARVDPRHRSPITWLSERMWEDQLAGIEPESFLGPEEGRE